MYEWRGRPFPIWTLVGLLCSLGLRGLVGSGQFILVPTGDVIGVSTAVLAPTPFRDFPVPGLFLFVGLGITPLVVSYGLYRGWRWAWGTAVVVVVVLAGWALLEGFLIGVGERLQYLTLVYGIGGVMLAVSSTVRSHCDKRVGRARAET